MSESAHLRISKFQWYNANGDEPPLKGQAPETIEQLYSRIFDKVMEIILHFDVPIYRHMNELEQQKFKGLICNTFFSNNYPMVGEWNTVVGVTEKIFENKPSHLKLMRNGAKENGAGLTPLH
jgi:hypothetical protein